MLVRNFLLLCQFFQTIREWLKPKINKSKHYGKVNELWHKLCATNYFMNTLSKNQRLTIAKKSKRRITIRGTYWLIYATKQKIIRISAATEKWACWLLTSLHRRCIFFVARFETSSNTKIFVLYELAVKLEIWNRCVHPASMWRRVHVSSNQHVFVKNLYPTYIRFSWFSKVINILSL